MQISKPLTALVGPYAITAVRYTPTSVLTCKTNQAPYNGFGQAPTNFAIERAIDLIARQLQLDRAAVRLRNLIQPDQFPYQIPTGATYDSGDYPTVLHKVLEMSGYANAAALKEEARSAATPGPGLHHRTECRRRWCVQPVQESGYDRRGEAGEVRLQVDVTGHVCRTIGFQSAGQGHETTVTQLVCEALQVDPNKVLVTRADSTGGVPSAATTGSRMHLMLGAAVLGAAAKIKDKMRIIAAQALGVEPGLLELRDGAFVARLLPNLRLSFAEVAGIAYRRATCARPTWSQRSSKPMSTTPKSGEREVQLGRRTLPRAVTSLPSAHVPMVEIDAETFDIKLTQYYIVRLRCRSSLIVAGLVYGGTMRGIDAACCQEYVYSDSDQLLSQSFMTTSCRRRWRCRT
jgi:CO/xanthine dehydrogenase Mo-binding subunit